MKKLLCTLLALVAATAALAKDQIEIAVIPMGTTHAFWKSIESGARKASEELGVKMNWRGPLKEDDRSQQIALVQQFVGSKIDGILLAPLDANALLSPVRAAKANNIPVVIMDSALKGKAGEDFASFVATNNRRGGELAGEEMVRLLGGRGKVALLRFSEGAESSTDREEGFISVIKKHPEIEIILSNRFAGPTTATAQDAAMNLIDKLREADGIFCPNESTTVGMLLALRQNGLAGKKKYVGFDSSSILLQALKKGDIQALVAQNPKQIGYVGVKTLVAAIRGEKVDQRIDTGCHLVTKDNIDTPELKAVLGEK
jgi:ribose transport system substrate-binding protein